MKKLVRVLLVWYVRIRSLSLMCSLAYAVTYSLLNSISSKTSLIAILML